MTTTEHASGTDRPTASGQLLKIGWHRLKTTLQELAMVLGTAAWAGFWIGIARLHYFDGDTPGVLVSGLLVLGGATLGVWRLSRIARALPFRSVERSQHSPTG